MVVRGGGATSLRTPAHPWPGWALGWFSSFRPFLELDPCGKLSFVPPSWFSRVSTMPTVGFLLVVSSLSAEVAPPPRVVAPPKMPLTGLAPAKLVADLCVYRYPVSTRSAECQAFCDQGFGYYYSYVWMEAARCFETALSHDPECAFAWLGLHRSLEKWGKGTTAPKPAPLLAAVGGVVQREAAGPVRQVAAGLRPGDGPRADAEGQPPRATAHPGAAAGEGDVARTSAGRAGKKAQASLDELLTLYDDDQEGWFWRAQIAEGPNAKAPFYKALLAAQPAAPRGEPRAGPLLRERQAAGARLAVRRGVHQVVARHPARLPHAGPPRHADRQVGADHRLELEGDRAPEGVPQVPGREAGRGPPVLPPPGDADAAAWSTTAGSPRRGGSRPRPRGTSTTTGRSGSAWRWPSGTGTRRRR